MGYIRKDEVIQTIEEDMKISLMCYTDKASKNIVRFCYEGVMREIDKLPQYRVDNVQEDEYLSIGTVEECREAREKQRPKEPKLYGDLEDGKMLCASCNEDLMDLAECGFNYCPYCGQKLDWGGEGE